MSPWYIFCRNNWSSLATIVFKGISKLNGDGEELLFLYIE
jgi:hypothetical protein